MTTEELNMWRGLRAEVAETLVKFDKSIADLEKQLAEAEKPKLRHGDYGCDGSLFFVQGETVFWLNAGGVASGISPERFGTAGRLGNLIDEIKALGEERTEWKLDREGLRVSLREGSHITHPVWLSGKYLTLSEAESLSLALRQIIATAKRKAGA